MTRTTKTPTATYLRDLVPAEKCGQCPCCLRTDIRSSERGTLVRHGWKEVGRRVGQYGQGFQSGECLGWNRRPLETTDADALDILVALDKRIAACEAAYNDHATKGADAYYHDFTLKTEYEHDDAARKTLVARFVKGFKKLGLEFTDSETTIRVESIRVFYHKAHAFRFTIARGAAEEVITYRLVTAKDDLRYSKDSVAERIPSYEELRKAHCAELETLIKALRRQRDAIKAAIKHHFENPSNGQKDAKRRTKLVHLAKTFIIPETSCRPGTTLEERTRKGVACPKRATQTANGRQILAKTENKDEVTCPKCKALIDKGAV